MDRSRVSRSRKTRGRKLRGAPKQTGQRIIDQVAAANARKLDSNKLIVWWGKPPKRPHRPRGPTPGADFTTVQLINTFTVETGLTSGSIQAIPTTNTLGSIAVTVGDLLQIASFSAIFDQYRVEKLHFRFSPDSNLRDDTQSSSPNQSVPSLYVVVDHDDSSAPSTLSALQDYDNVEVCQGTEGMSVEFIPSVTPAVYAQGAFSAYEVRPSDRTWLDVANTTCPFYGVKFGTTALQTASTSIWIWTIQCWVTVSFKNIR
jgi:hypothetical protein